MLKTYIRISVNYNGFQQFNSIKYWITIGIYYKKMKKTLYFSSNLWEIQKLLSR